MTEQPAVDCYAGAGLRLSAAPGTARMVERAGFAGLWTLEAHTEPFGPLVLAAEHTERIRLGSAVAVALVRNPMVVAHLAHELNRYADGRFTLGLGSQVGAHVVARYGAPFDHPADRMAEFVAALRAIWACWNDDEPLRFRGRFYRHTLMTPAFHPGRSDSGPPRVALAAVGPRMTQVACEVADGLIAHPLSSRRYLQQVLRPRLAGRAGDGFELSCPVLVITGRDEAELASARSAVRRQLAFYASTPAYREVLEWYGRGGVATELSALSRRGEWAAMAALIDEELLAEFSVAAPIDLLGAALRERFAGVLDRVLVYAPYPIPDEVWGEARLG